MSMHATCPTCTCQAPAGEFTVYPRNEGFYGRCETCGEVRWVTEHDEYAHGDEDRRRYHCACCTHPHNLSPGGHDQRCLDDPANCILVKFMAEKAERGR
jgi:hypothetical protein